MKRRAFLFRLGTLAAAPLAVPVVGAAVEDASPRPAAATLELPGHPPRPMSPREVARDGWWREFIRVGVENHCR